MEERRTGVRLLHWQKGLVTRQLFMECQLWANLGTERSQAQALPPVTSSLGGDRLG